MKIIITMRWNNREWIHVSIFVPLHVFEQIHRHKSCDKGQSGTYIVYFNNLTQTNGLYALVCLCLYIHGFGELCQTECGVRQNARMKIHNHKKGSSIRLAMCTNEHRTHCDVFNVNALQRYILRTEVHTQWTCLHSWNEICVRLIWNDFMETNMQTVIGAFANRVLRMQFTFLIVWHELSHNQK